MHSREQYLEELVPLVRKIRDTIRTHGPDAVQDAIDKALALPAPTDQNPVTAVIGILAVIDNEDMPPTSCVWRVIAGNHTSQAVRAAKVGLLPWPYLRPSERRKAVLELAGARFSVRQIAARLQAPPAEVRKVLPSRRAA